MAGKKRPETRREVSEWLGISQSTLRNWDAKFRPWLESEVGQKGVATRKRYTEGDLVVFATIKGRLAEGATFKNIQATLDDDIRATVLDWEEPARDAAATSSLPTVSERERGALIQAQQAREELAMVAGQLQAIVDERDRLLEELAGKQEESDELRERAAAAEAQAKLAAEMLESQRQRRRFRWPWQREE